MSHIENGFLVLDNEKIKEKKITGSRVGKLMGVDPFDLKGDCVAEMFGIVKTEVNEFYKVRGDLAENVATLFYKRIFNDVIHHNPKDCKWDLFADIKGYGGVIDIEIPSAKTLIEVKAKNMKDYDKVVNDGVPSQEIQGKFYGVLKKYNYVLMFWCFFDDELENKIKEQMELNKIGFPIEKFTKEDFQNIKYFEKEIQVNAEELKPQFRQAYDYYKWCFDNRKIPLNDISEKTLEKLGLKKS